MNITTSDKENNECPNCWENYNLTIRSKVTCMCNFTICNNCARTHIMISTNQPNCQNLHHQVLPVVQMQLK